MNKTYEEWIDYIKGFMGIFQVYDIDDEYIKELAKQCTEFDNLQEALGYCIDHLHEHFYGK